MSKTRNEIAGAKAAAMQYQLVLEFAADTISDYDALVAIERQLIDALGENIVDGHDMGSGEANIFILASDPQNLSSDCSCVGAHWTHFARHRSVPPHGRRSISRLMAREFLATV